MFRAIISPILRSTRLGWAKLSSETCWAIGIINKIIIVASSWLFVL